MNKTFKRTLSLTLAFVMIFSFGNIRVSKADNIDEMIENMTLEEKIGQMLMVEFRYWTENGGERKPVTELNDEIREAIKKYKFGGIILFAENVVETEQTTRLTHDIQKTSIDNDVLPMLLSIDQEGGIVVRLGTGTSLPGNMALGATRDNDLAYRYGQIIGEEIKSLGININLAPSLDVNNNPNNPVIGLRSISSDPHLVGELGSNVIKGLQDTGVSAAVKHFPGHGDTAVDSHVGLPEVDKSLEEVNNMELIPFRKAANEGVDMIMTSHISYPQLEKDTAISKSDGSEVHIPATLSDDILTGIIREDMGYDGIIITDAMNMKAISTHFGEEEAVLMTIQAGTDIPLMPTSLQSTKDLEKLDSIIDTVVKAVDSGELTEERIDQSVRRILELKQRRNILDLEQYNKPLDEKISNALNVVGSQEHFDDQREITQKAITVTKNDNDTLPLYPKEDEKVLILTPYANELPGFQYGSDKLKSEGIINENAVVDVKQFTKNTTMAELEEYAKNYDYIIAVSEIGSVNQMSKDFWLANVPDQFTRLAKENNKQSVIISIGKPYDVGRYEHADAVVVAYGAKGMDPTEKGKDPVKTFGPNIPFSLDVVFGKVASSGKLPVNVPKLSEDYKYLDEVAYNIGHGLVTRLKINVDITINLVDENGDLIEQLDSMNYTGREDELEAAIEEFAKPYKENSKYEYKYSTKDDDGNVILEFTKVKGNAKGFIIGKTNVRRSPNGQIIGTLEREAIVEGEYEEGSNWVKFDYYGQEAYVYKPLLSNALEVRGFASGDSNIRKSPNGQITAVAKREDIVIGVVSIDNPNWVKTNKGYIYRPLIVDTLQIKGLMLGATNVRMTPNGYIFGKLGNAEYVEGTINITTPNWVRTRYQNRDGYVYRSLIGDTVSVNGRTTTTLNVRQAPNSKVLGTLNKGSVVNGKVSVNNPNWVEVQYKGQRAYVYKYFVK